MEKQQKWKGKVWKVKNHEGEGRTSKNKCATIIEQIARLFPSCFMQFAYGKVKCLMGKKAKQEENKTHRDIVILSEGKFWKEERKGQAI